MNIYFRVDASAKMGLGHLMRCLALAQEVEFRHATPVFFIRSHTHAFCLSRHDWVGKIVLIPDELSQEQELDWLGSQLQLESAPKMLVLDGYQFDTDYKKGAAQRCDHLVVFDDNNDAGLLHGNLVINGSHGAKKLDYAQTAPHAKLCLGPDFRVLRSEFSLTPHSEWSARFGLLISMGGSDPNNMTLPLLKELARRQFDGPIRVITGAGYAYLPELEAWLASSHLHIQHMHNFQMMADAFSRARLAVVAAGGTQYEVEAMATPAFLLVVADNQIKATQSALSSGWCEAADVRTCEISDVVEQLLALWNNETKLQDMYIKATESGSCAGAANVVDDMLLLLDNA